MTRDEYAEKLRQMTARELDAEVAEKVMGFSKPLYAHPPELHHEVGGRIVVSGWYCQPDYRHGDVCEWHPIHYSTDIAAAWEVVEKITDSRQMTRIISEDIAYARFANWWNKAYLLTYVAEDAPRAICIAACLAVRQDDACPACGWTGAHRADCPTLGETAGTGQP